jgi:hypothetical protein
MANTTRPMIRIHNAETNEIIDREMNDAEFTEWEAEQAAAAAIAAAESQKAAEKTAILSRLGLTQSELETILG